MGVISIDVPLLVLGLGTLLFGRFFLPRYTFQILCQLVGTIQAQYSWVLAWSLGRLTPLLAASRVPPRASRAFIYFLPFVAYGLVITILLAPTWKIPGQLEAAYGKYRYLIQLANFATMAAAAAAFAEALEHPRAPYLLFDGLSVLAVLHGGASVYQMVASFSGLPIIGISRAFQDDANMTAAAFDHEGVSLLRPGGLAGEPKTAAVFFALYLLVRLYAQLPRPHSSRRAAVEAAALWLSIAGLLLTWSTSGFVGLLLAGAVLAFRFGLRRSVINRSLLLICVGLSSWSLVSSALGLRSLSEVLEARTTQRLREQDRTSMDPPVAVSLELIRRDPMVALFGTGLGGSSFLIMEELGPHVPSYAANIGWVLTATELGFVGTLLLLLPMGLLGVLPAPRSPTDHAAWRFYCCAGIGTLLLHMTGSGLPMGLSLSIGAMSAAGGVAMRK